MTPPPGDQNDPIEDDPLGGMDPMAWLESLAKRQGANTDEFTTAANIDVPPPPPDAVPTDPGYTPGTGGSTGAVRAVNPDVPPSPPVSAPAASITPAKAEPKPDVRAIFGRLDSSRSTANDADQDDDRSAAPAASSIFGSRPAVRSDASVEPPPAAHEPVAPEPVSMSVSSDDVGDNTSDSAADADDPLGGMDPMAWLESLAKRQGANADELTTAADIDVPPPPPDAVPTDPGYTPGTGGTSRPAVQPAIQPAAQIETPQPAIPALSSTPVSEAAPLDIPVSSDGPTDRTPVVGLPAPAASFDTPLPAASITAPIDGPTTPVEMPRVAAEMPEPTPASIQSDAELGALLGDVDPMKWLESLAKGQGAELETLMTSADVDVPPPPPDAVPTGPGYTAFDSFGSTFKPTEPPRVEAAPPEPISQPPVQPAAQPAAQFEQPEAVPAGVDFDFSTLSATTDDADTADLDDLFDFSTPLPAAQTTAEPVEAGLSPDQVANAFAGFDPFADEPFADAVEPLAESYSTDSDPLAWLNNLQSSPGEDTFGNQVSQLSSAIRSDIPLKGDEFTESPVQSEPVPAGDFYDTFDTSFMSGTDSGEADGNDPMAWLSNVAEEEGVSVAELTEGVPADVQPESAESAYVMLTDPNNSADEQTTWNWLESLTSEPDPADMNTINTAVNAQITEFNPEPEELVTDSVEDFFGIAPRISGSGEPPPIREDVGLPAAQAVPDWFFEPETVDQADDELSVLFSREQPTFSIEETEALTRPASATDIDDWASALDEEFDRKQAGDEAIPSWFEEAMRRAEASLAEADQPALPEPSYADQMISAVEEEEPLEPAVLPDWMSQPTQEAAIGGDMPDWIRAMMGAPAAVESVTPEVATPNLGDTSWLENLEQVEAETAPDWMRPEEPVVEPVLEDTVFPPPAQPEPVQPPPREPVRIEPVRTEPVRPVRDPERLRRARQFVQSAELAPALEVYQSLIDTSDDLEEARGDLRQLAEQNPTEPRLSRLLGDTHMRLGDLQSALDAYRGALNRL